jgi:hypothetical protein
MGRTSRSQGTQKLNSIVLYLSCNIVLVTFSYCFKEVGFEVLTAVSTKMAVFWVVMLCSLVEVYQCFGGPCCLHHQGDALMMEAARTSETLVNFYQTTRCYNPEDSPLCFKEVSATVTITLDPSTF